MTTTGDVVRVCECVNADVRKCRCAALKRRAVYIPVGGDGAVARPGEGPEVSGTGDKRPRRTRGLGRIIKKKGGEHDTR